MKNASYIRHLLTAAMAVVSFLSVTATAAEVLPVSSVSYDRVLSDAKAIASQRSDLSVMTVSGVSMLPFFGEESVLVVKKIDAAKLRVGMIAVYVNSFGEKVAHRIEASVNGGWQVRGYNNNESDSTIVTGSNLLGVVYATFHSAGRSTMSLASNSMHGVETVLAAPAK